MMVKFCGMTNLEDAKYAVDLGVDFIGFVFYKKSPRYVKPENVRIITKYLKGYVNTVGVFVEENENDIGVIRDFCGLDYVQVYKDVNIGNTIRAYRIRDNLPKIKDEGLILFDNYSKVIGGSGKSFDFNLLKAFRHKNRLFVAGGINIENIFSVKKTGVFGVDLVSSIEAYKGKKDFHKMRMFMEVARNTL